MATQNNSTADREMVITRLIDAPRELVFQVWTDPVHLLHWWGPKGFTNTFYEHNANTGGVWRFMMHAPDGTNFPNRIQYEEVVAPERLSYIHGTDEEPEQFKGQVLFEAQGSKTMLTLRITFPTVQAVEDAKRYGALEGGNQTIDRLEERIRLVKGETDQAQFSITRVVDAPLDLVWKAHTEKEHLAHWWGPKGFALKVTQFDFKPGGTFVYNMEAPNGFSMWGRFVYREIVPQQRMVFVSSFSDENGGLQPNPMQAEWPLETMNTASFRAENGKTVVTITAYPINATEAEAQIYRSGFSSMQQGFGGTYDKLDAYLASL